MNAISSTYNNIKSILPQAVEWINVLCAIYLSVTLILPFEYQRPALYAYFSSLAIDIIANQRYKNVKWEKSKLVFIPMILFYLCIWIWHIFEETTIYHFNFVTENRLPFLVFGFLGLFTKINPKLKPEYIALPMLITSILSVAYLIIFKIQIPTIIASPDITFYQEKFEFYRISVLKASHMEFNLYLNFAIFFGLYALTKFKKKWLKILIFTCIILIFVFLLTNYGRVGFFTGIILFLAVSTFIIVKRNKKLLLPTYTLLIIGFISISLNNKHVKDIFTQENIRIAIWEHAVKIIKEKTILGYGVSDGRLAFVNNTNENEKFYTDYISMLSIHSKSNDIYMVHSHNIFLESTIEFGIVGLILISSILILPIITTKKKQQLFIIMLIFIFGMQAMFEILRDYLPPIYLSWFLYIFLLTPINENKE